MKISDNILVALATGLPATIASLATLINSIKNGNRIKDNTEITAAANLKIEVLNEKVDVIHERTNGIQEALVKSTARASHAEGMADQRAEDRAYKKNT